MASTINLYQKFAKIKCSRIARTANSKFKSRENLVLYSIEEMHWLRDILGDSLVFMR